jgi:energy-coupling factor transport system permease protein
MNTALDPRTWLFWAAVAGLSVVVTRNPLYLLLTTATVGSVYLSIDRHSALAIAWGTVLRIGVVVALISVLFNVLTVHVGDRVLWRLPGSIPILGGPLTLNAALWGVVSGIALANLLLIAATFSSVVDRASILRLIPRRLGSTGLAAVTALSFFPQTLEAFGRVREAHASRGFQIRSIRDVRMLIVPVLNRGLEQAFSLAESLESRGFGRAPDTETRHPLLAPGALASGAGGVVAFGTGHAPIAILLGAAGVALGLRLVWGSERAIEIDEHRSMTRTDVAILAASSITVVAVLVELLTTGSTLVWSPYPRLEWPAFDLVVGLGYAALVLPAVLAPRYRPAESNDAAG